MPARSPFSHRARYKVEFHDSSTRKWTGTWLYSGDEFESLVVNLEERLAEGRMENISFERTW